MKNNKPTFKVIIAGSRQFYDYSLLKEKCLKILSDELRDCDIQIICGCARGTDTIDKQMHWGYMILYAATGNLAEDNDERFDNYEQALEAGLQRVIKLIKK